MDDAKVYASDIDEILLVGGMTKNADSTEKVEEIFGKESQRGLNRTKL